MNKLVIYNRQEISTHKEGLQLSELVKPQTVKTLSIFKQLCTAKETGQANSEAFLAIVKHEREMTMKMAITEGTGISLLRKDNAQLLEDSVLEMLYLFRDKFSRKNSISDMQIITLAMDLIHNYWRLKLEEFLIVLKDIVKGKYGTVYNLEVPFILNCFEQYSEASSNYKENISATKTQQYKHAKFDKLTEDQLERLYKQEDEESQRDVVRRSSQRSSKTDSERYDDLNKAIQKRHTDKKREELYSGFTIDQLRTAYMIAKKDNDTSLMAYLKDKGEQLKNK